MNVTTTRRHFLRLIVVGAGGSLLAACTQQPPASPKTEAKPAESKPAEAKPAATTAPAKPAEAAKPAEKPAAEAKPAQQAPAAAPSGKPITVVQAVWPATLDSSMDTNVGARVVYSHILEAPVVYRYDPAAKSMKFEGQLAERWENMAPDRWRFYLRKGVKFHNGEDVNSEAAAFSLNTIKGNKGMGSTFLAHMKEVIPVDSHTFDLVTEGPYAATPDSTAFLFFLPPRYYGEAGGKEGFGKKPIGTGPYRFVEWQEGVHIKVQAHSEYWGPKPQIPAITFRANPEVSTRVALLETGEADIITYVAPELIDRVQAAQRVEMLPSLRRIFAFFDLKTEPTNNVLLRKAVNYAVDIPAITRSVLGGHGYPAKGLNKPGYVGYAPDKLEGYSYNPDKARQLLAEAGYSGGVEFDFNHPIGRYLLDKEVVTAIAGQLSKVGINARLKGVEFNTLASLYGSQNATGLNLWSVGPLWLDPAFEWQVHFWSNGLYRYNADPKQDELLTRGRTTIAPEERARTYQELEKYIVDERCLWLHLYDDESIFGVSKRVQWQPSPDEMLLLQFASSS